MKIFALLASSIIGTAAAEHYAFAGEAPICEVDASGLTHVYYSAAVHPSFKCSHSGDTCTCTLQHPTHHTGGCKQLESKATGKLLNGGGDCTDSGLTVTPAPTPVPWSGSNLANAVSALRDGEMIYLAAGTYNWDSEKVINGGNQNEIKKTITIMGAGKGNTIIDGMTGSYRLTRLMYGAQVNLVDLTVQNFQSNGPGAVVFSEYRMCKVTATRVEFKNNKSVHHDGGVYGTQEGKNANGYDQIGEFIDCDFIDNEGNGGGGAAAVRGTTTFTRCTFTGNQAGFGGAVQVRINENGVCTFEDCTFTNNKSTKWGHSKGGAFYVDRGTVKFIGTNSFSGNQATFGTGENNACAKGTRSDIAFENLPSTLSGSSCA